MRIGLVSAMIAVTAVAVGPSGPSGAVAGPFSAAPRTVAAAVTALPTPIAGAEVFPRPADGVYDVVGGGFGHGIGMSQYGAQGAALQGLSAAKILAFYYPGTTLVTQAPANLRIGITSDNDGVVQIGARSGLSMRVGDTTTTLPAAPLQWRVSATSTTASSCKVESYNGSTWSTYQAGSTPCPVTFSAPEGTVDVYLPSGERRIYRGTITATHIGTTKLLTVNATATQLYLRGVVPSEMPASWQAAALQSQAVAARTYASRGSNGTAYYDTCDTTSCQVYKGRGRRNADGTIASYEDDSTNAAIAATDGQVLTYLFSDGVTRLATTMYSSSNGGYSAPGSPGHPYLSAHSDPYDTVSSNARHAWTALLPASSLESRFGIYRVERLQIVSRDGDGQWGGRVLSARVEGYTSGGAYTYVDTTGNGLMAAHSWPTWSDGLSSNYFTITGQQAGAVRIAGPDRYATAARISDEYPSGVSVVYVASGLTFPDALAGAARAAYNDGPLLLTDPDYLPTATRDAMTRLRPSRVVVLGGTGAVSDSVAQALASLTTSGNLQRVAGADRFATAAALAGYYPAGGAVAYVASGLTFPDALSGAAIAGRDHAPVLLTRLDELPASTVSALKRLSPGRIVVLGGVGAVSSAVATQLRSLAVSGTVTRISGPDRYATAAAVAAQYPSATQAVVASGETFPDALAGAALAGRNGAPMLLATSDSLPAPTTTQLERLRPDLVMVLGGVGAIGTAVMTAITAAIG